MLVVDESDNIIEVNSSDTLGEFIGDDEIVALVPKLKITELKSG